MMFHFIAGPILGALVYHLYQKHKTRGVAQCSECDQFEQVGTNLKFIATFDEHGKPNQEIGFCRKCKPSIFA
jgi:hypothetical protein